MKRAYLTDGYVTQPLGERDNLAYVDAATWNYLHGLLYNPATFQTDYCYLVIHGQEVMKVTGLQAPNILYLARALDGTKRKTWIAGRRLEYKLTMAEITDATHFVGYKISVSGPMQFDGVNVSYMDMEIATLGGIDVGGDNDSGFLIEDAALNAGPDAGCTPPVIPDSWNPYRCIDDLATVRSTDDGSPRQYV